MGTVWYFGFYCLNFHSLNKFDVLKDLPKVNTFSEAIDLMTAGGKHMTQTGFCERLDLGGKLALGRL